MTVDTARFSIKAGFALLAVLAPCGASGSGLAADTTSLPAVVYPSRDPGTGDRGSPAPPPEPATIIAQEPPMPYVVVDGARAYRDHERHFHPRPSEPVTQPVGGGVARPAHSGVALPSPTARPFVASLPNGRSRAIVVRPSEARERGQAH